MVQATFPEIQVEGSGQLYARFVTSMGTLVARLDDEKAPKTVRNFVGLATGTQDWIHPRTNEPSNGKSLYAGTIFHRVIPDFMIQCGCPLGQGTGGPGYRFADEFHKDLRPLDGELGPRHQWLAVLHHGERDRMARQPSRGLRKGHRRSRPDRQDHAR